MANIFVFTSVRVRYEVYLHKGIWGRNYGQTDPVPP
jgi:hypothetical protein